jgi:hypothetical protein
MTALKAFIDTAVAVGEVNQDGVAVLFEEDFTVLANQNLITGGDGNKTINGKTYYVANTANATTFDILNGTGLRIFPNTTNTFWSGATRTAPLIGIRLPHISDKLRSLAAAPPVTRFWVIFASDQNANTERFALGVENADDTAYWTLMGERIFSTSQGWRLTTTINGVVDNTALATGLLTHNVMMLKVYHGAMNAELFTGVSISGNFPDEANMYRRGWFAIEESGASQRDGLTDVLSSIACAMAASPANTAGNLQVTVTKFKVDAIGLPPLREPGMLTVMDLDFTTEPTQNLITGGDGDKTVAGKTWYAVNTANASKLAITNGVGLEIDCNTANTLFSTTSRSGPLLGLLLTELGVEALTAPFIRIWCIRAHNANATAEETTLALERKQSGGFSSSTYWAFHGMQQNTGATANWYGFVQLNGANGTATADATNSTDDVVCIQVSLVTSQALLFTGVSVGGDFPEFSTLRMKHSMDMHGTVSAALMKLDPLTEVGAFLGAASGNATGTLETTWTRMKVEVPSTVGNEAAPSTEVITPPQLTAAVNDYTPTGWDGADVVRVSSDASRNVTGAGPNTTQKRKTIINVGSNDVVIKHQDAGSLAGNRFLNATGADITLGADDWVHLFYDGVTQRWRVAS